jgi:hypothetical protein
MSNDSGWDQDRSARGELDHQFAVPHDEVAAFLRVIVAESCDWRKSRTEGWRSRGVAQKQLEDLGCTLQQ